jgi:hypothetical protein
LCSNFFLLRLLLFLTTIFIKQVQEEVNYFYTKLGMEPSYFRQLQPKEIANHILCLYSAKTFSALSETAFGIDVRREDASSALYICNSTATMALADQILPPSYEIERCVFFLCVWWRCAPENLISEIWFVWILFSRIEMKYLGEGLGWETSASGKPVVFQ